MFRRTSPPEYIDALRSRRRQAPAGRFGETSLPEKSHMKLFAAQILRSRWLSGLVHAGLWLLVYLAAIGLQGHAPWFRQADGTLPPPHPAPAIGKLDRLFVEGSWPNIQPGTNNLNPFFTRHFTPAPAPAPPPPTTRKVALVYQGFFTTDGGSPQTMVKMGEKFLTTPVGSNITANLYAAQATVMSLLLTNPAGETNLLLLDKSKEVEVPIK